MAGVLLVRPRGLFGWRASSSDGRPPAACGSTPWPCSPPPSTSSPTWSWPGGKSTVNASEFLIWAIFATGLNLLWGHTGDLSFGHGMFFGWGAYTAGRMSRRVAFVPLDLAVAAVVAMLVAYPLAKIIVRRATGIYFAMITLAIGEMFYFLAIRMTKLDRRGERPRRHPAREAGRDRPRPPGQLLLHDRRRGLRLRAGRLAHHPFAVRPGVPVDPAEPGPGPVPRLRPRPLPGAGLRVLGRDLRRGRRALGLPVPPRGRPTRCAGRPPAKPSSSR